MELQKRLCCGRQGFSRLPGLAAVLTLMLAVPFSPARHAFALSEIGQDDAAPAPGLAEHRDTVARHHGDRRLPDPEPPAQRAGHGLGAEADPDFASGHADYQAVFETFLHGQSGLD